MISTTAVVVGAGHAGLAMSRRLSERSIDHMVLERGQVANSWRTQRWPSLRLLTPNWQTQLPGHDYAGDDPDGYMQAGEVADTLTEYSRLISAPVRPGLTVHTVRAGPHGFQLQAGEDMLRAQAVVVATEPAPCPPSRRPPTPSLLRSPPSPQLTGTPQRATTDLNSLAAQGVRITGRLGRITGGVAQFSGGLANVCALADLKMNRFLTRADQWASASGLDGDLPPPHRLRPTRVDPRTPLELDLTGGEITTILWATGLRPDHSCIDIPAFDRTGRIRHDGGVVTAAPGLYLLGLPVLRTRASTYIHGAVPDTQALAGHLHSFLNSRHRCPAPDSGVRSAWPGKRPAR